MLRKLAVFILSAGLTISPAMVQAMGFGGIKLKSALNEKLDAEVALVAATPTDIQSLNIKLATEAAYLRAGIDRTAFLNKLRFKVKQRANGNYYIHITSTETVREPFVNFLLEMEWKNGRMLREYTMLVDPPGRAPQVAEPAPVIAETAPVEEEPVAEPVVAEETPFVEPVSQPEAAPAATEVAEAPAEPVAPAEDEVTVEAVPVPEPVEPAPEVNIPAPADEPAVAEAPEPFNPDAIFEEEDSGELWPRIPLTEYREEDGELVDSGEAGDLDYGIIKENDKLWDIAQKLRRGHEDVTVYQMMMALLKSNPDAFINNNVNGLKVGHVLRIDDPTILTSISRQEAAQAFRDQTEAWNAYRQQAADAAGVQPIIAGEESTTATADTTAGGGELTLAAPEGEALTAGGGASEEALSNDLATIQEQLRQAKRDAGTQRTRNVELNNKLQALEKELNRLQRSLSVKDDELAALQQQLAALDQKPVVTPQPVPEPEPVVAEPAAAAEQPAAEAAPADMASAEPQPEAPAATEEANKPEPAAAPAKPEKSPVQLAEEIAQSEPAPAQEQGIMDTVMGVLASLGGVFAGLSLGSDSLLFIAAPILLVFLIVLVIVIRRRRAENFQESILTGTATANDDTTAAASGDSTTFSEESSFLSDFAMSGASAIEADDSEVDPLTEADVFMAYGRYEAAEERLTDAIKNDPERGELRAKLLELYHSTQNKAAFEAAAEDFYASLGGQEADNPLWQKVVSMGQEIAADNPLFSAASADAVPATSEIPAIDDPGMAMTDSQVMDIGLETGVFEAADLSADKGSSDDANLDFNLDLGESTATEDNAAPDLDFNLDIGGDETAKADEPSADLDFDLDAAMAETETAAEPAADTDNSADAGLDFNLDSATTASDDAPLADLDFNLDSGSETAEEPVADLNLDMDTAPAADDAGLDFNLDSGGETATDTSEEISLDFDTGSTDDAALDLNLDASDTAEADISGGDEVGTKLDLAKAYIDMGDPEGARSILDEVMDEGNSSQKEEAQSLLAQIA